MKTIITLVMMLMCLSGCVRESETRMYGMYGEVYHSICRNSENTNKCCREESDWLNHFHRKIAFEICVSKDGGK